MSLEWSKIREGTPWSNNGENWHEVKNKNSDWLLPKGITNYGPPPPEKIIFGTVSSIVFNLSINPNGLKST